MCDKRHAHISMMCATLLILILMMSGTYLYDSYTSDKNEINITISGADAQTNDKIESVLNSTDEEILIKIDSIDVLTQNELNKTCESTIRIACTNNKWTKDGLVSSKIYMLNSTQYEKLNKTICEFDCRFEYMLYHEIGHVMLGMKQNKIMKIANEENEANQYKEYRIKNAATL